MQTAAGLPVADVGVLVLAAGAAVATVGEDVEVAVLAGLLVLVGVPPWIGRHGFLEVRALPFGDAGRRGVERGEALLGGGVAADIETVGFEGFLEGVDLCLGGLHFGLADLREIARRDVARQEADDDHDDEEFEEGEAGKGKRPTTDALLASLRIHTDPLLDPLLQIGDPLPVASLSAYPK